MGIELLQLVLSGGAANTSPAASTGGVPSTNVVLSQAVALTSPIPGVTIANAAGNALGTGTLTYDFVGQTLSWTAPGEVIEGIPISIGANGTYLIRGANTTSGYVIVTVVSAGLSNAVNYTISGVVTNQNSLLLPPVSKDVALAGATEYFLYYLANNGATAISTAAVAISQETTGLDTIGIAIIPAKNTQELLAAASGHSYTAAGTPIAMGTLNAGDYWGFWIKRVTPAATINGTVSDTFQLQVTALT